MDLRRAWKITDSSGTDRTEKLAPYFRQLAVRDRAGKVSDEAILSLSNDPPIEIPDLGKALTLYMGEGEGDLVNLGTHYVTDYGIGGPPDRLDIVTRPVYFGGGDDPNQIEAPGKAQEARNERYALTTLGKIAGIVAGRMGIELAIGSTFAPFVIEQVEQRRESDPAFITRMAKLAGGIAKIAPGVLVIGTPHDLKSYGRSAGMPTIDLIQEDVASYQFGWSARKAPGTVAASWFNVKTGQYRTETAGNNPPVTAVRKTHGSRDSAIRAAQSLFDQLGREKRPASVSFHRLRLNLWVGSKIDIGAPWHPNIRDTWEVVGAAHVLSASGGSTTVEIERQTNQR